MNCRTGDILVWRSTGFWDTFSDISIGIKGLHSGLILVGNKFESLSVCGPSPSQTYVTFLIDKVFPIEEVIGMVWVQYNGSCLYLIRRTGGPDINPDLAINAIREIVNMKKLSIGHTVYISIAAYFKYGDIAPTTGHENRKWQLCSLFIEYLLNEFGLLSNEAIINNILPIDFYNLEFYQKYHYECITIFDKGTHTVQSWFNAFFINFGFIVPEPIHHPIIESIMGDYSYPKFNKKNITSTQELFSQE